MKLIFFFLFFTSVLLTQASELNCPSNSYIVEYQNPFDAKKTRWCQTTIDGKFIKKGPEETFLDGKWIKTATYQKGNRVEEKVIQKPINNPTEKKEIDLLDGHTSDSNEKSDDDEKMAQLILKRPSKVIYHSSGVGLALQKPIEQYQKELQEYYFLLLDNLLNGIDLDQNEFAVAFKTMNISDSEKRNKLMNYFNNQMRSYKYDVLSLEKHPLTPLFQEVEKSIREGDAESLRKFIVDLGVPADYYIKDHVSPVNLVSADKKKGKELIKVLLSTKFNLNTIGPCQFTASGKCGDKDIKFLCTPLDVAMKNHNLDVVEILLAYKVNLNGSVISTNMTPLAHAIHNGFEAGFSALVNIDESVLKTAFKGWPCFVKGNNPLGLALQERADFSFANIILSKGISLNESDPNPLDAAMEFVKSNGENAKDKDKLALERMLWAQSKGFKIKEFLDKDDEPLRKAIRRGLTSVVMSFIDSGIDVNKENAEKRTPVYHLFESIDWSEGRPPNSFSMNRKKEDPNLKLMRLEILKYIFNHQGKRQILDKFEKGLKHYSALETPFSDHLSSYLEEKSSF